MPKVHDNETYLKISEVAEQLGRTAFTIRNWYLWREQATEAERAALPELPPIFNTLDKKGTRYFKEVDMPILVHFRDAINYGMMSDFNKTRWGKRGKSDDSETTGVPN